LSAQEPIYTSIGLLLKALDQIPFAHFEEHWRKNIPKGLLDREGKYFFLCVLSVVVQGSAMVVMAIWLFGEFSGE
jgi:hypothetical protein